MTFGIFLEYFYIQIVLSNTYIYIYHVKRKIGKW